MLPYSGEGESTSFVLEEEKVPFMKASISIIKVCSAGSKLISGRKRTSRLFSSAALLDLLSFPCSFEDKVFDESVAENEQHYDLLPSSKCTSVQCPEVSDGIFHDFGGNDRYEFVDKKATSLYNIERDEHELKKIKLVLRSLGWNLGSQTNSYSQIELDECNIVKILNDLFKESADAALAFYFFRWSRCCSRSEHTVRSTCTMVHILVAGNMNHRAVDLIVYLVRKNNGKDWWPNFLFKVLHETHTERRVLVTAFSMLVDCYAKENMTSTALTLTSQMKQIDIFPSMRVYNKLLRALLQSEQIKLAWDLLEDIQNQGLDLNVSIISLFIHKYCRKGNLERGWKLLIEMKNHGINPDIVMYTIFIDSLCKMSHLREATSLLFKIREMGVSLDSVSISLVIDSFCRVGNPHKAITILKIFNQSLNIYIYNSFIARFCSDFNIAAASDLFLEMSDLGLRPDCVCYTTMIGGFCKIRDMHSGLKFVGMMLKRAIKPSATTYTIFMQAYCQSGDMDEAENMLDNMLKDGVVPDIVAYNTLMNGYGKQGLLHKVFELLDRMNSLGISPDNVTYNSIIHSLILRGYTSEAKDLLEELVRRGFAPDVVTFTDMVSGFSKMGNFEEAFLVWFHMSEHQIKPDLIACSALLSGYCTAKRMIEANALFYKMLDMGLVPDVILYNTLIHGFCNMGSIREALELVKLMVQHGINPNEVTHLALVLGYKNKWVQNPVRIATLKMQQILLKYGD